MSFRIGFKLMDLDGLLDYSTNPDLQFMNNRQNTLKSLYSLSLGWLWFEMEDGVIPQAYSDFKKTYPDYDHSPRIDYQVLQLFSDLEEFMPVVLNPLPSILSRVIRTEAWEEWRRRRDEFRESLDWKQIPESFREAVNSTVNWWNWRKLEMWYLVAPPSLRFWSPDPGTVQIEWDTREKHVEGVLSMIEAAGSLILTRAEFLEGVSGFRDDLLNQLQERAHALERRGLIDGAGRLFLIKQWEMYRQSFSAALTRPSEEDWPAVLAAIRQLEPLIGPLF